MRLEIKNFDQLTTHQLYELLRLRSQVFVVEQDCVYQDVDGKDFKAVHILGYQDKTLAAYTRIFQAGDYFNNASIGRVVVHPEWRGKQLGQEIMIKSITYCKKQEFPLIQISAQCYLDTFYKNLGFIATGSTYLEDGIPHQKMLLEL